MSYSKDKNPPQEIPNQKKPGETTPLKDPSQPSKNNPINPKTDEPTGYKK